MTTRLLPACLLITAGLARSQEPMQALQPIAQSDLDGSVLVCKRLEVTGSRIKQRVCLAQREWDALREESLETMEKLRREVSRNF